MGSQAGDVVTILVVDDEPDMLHLLVELMRSAFPDARVLSAGSVAAALAAADTGPVRVTVSDYKLPDGNGLDLLAAVARRNPGMGRVLLTAYADSSLQGRSGVDVFFAKPVRPGDLREAVARLLA